MATIVQGPMDPRQAALQGGVEKGVAAFLEARKKKKQEAKFLDAYKMVNEAPDYDTAVSQMAMMDPELLSNPEAVKLINEQISRKFPEQETLEVIDPRTKKKEVIKHAKGRPPSDAELAVMGKTRVTSSGITDHFAFDEATGDVDVLPQTTPEEAAAAAPDRMVVNKEGASSSAALMQAYNGRIRAENAGKTGSKPDKATQFEQEVIATQSRLGIEDRNQAITVVQHREPTLKAFREFFTKSANGEIAFTDDIARGHISNAETILEPALVATGSPDVTRQLMHIDAAYNIANDPNITMKDAKDKAANDFMRMTGIAAYDTDLQKVVQQANASLQEGQEAEVVVKKAGNKSYTIRVAKIGGRVIPLARIEE
jgi:hypothetical protein